MMNENRRKSKIYENLQNSTKDSEYQRKSTKICENLQKPMKIFENLRRSITLGSVGIANRNKMRQARGNTPKRIKNPEGTVRWTGSEQVPGHFSHKVIQTLGGNHEAKLIFSRPGRESRSEVNYSWAWTGIAKRNQFLAWGTQSPSKP